MQVLSVMEARPKVTGEYTRTTEKLKDLGCGFHQAED